MPELNNVENALLRRMEARAASLRNGGKTIEVLSEAVADMLEVLAAMVRSGGVTPAECSARHAETIMQIARERSEYVRGELETRLKERSIHWKTALAVCLPICSAAVAVALPVVLHLVKGP